MCQLNNYHILCDIDTALSAMFNKFLSDFPVEERILSYDIASESVIKPCIKSNNQLVD